MGRSSGILASGLTPVGGPRVDLLRTAFYALKRKAAPGVTIGVTSMEVCHRANTPSRLATGSTDSHNRLLLRPCRCGSNLRHIGLVEWDDVGSPFQVRRRDFLPHVT